MDTICRDTLDISLEIKRWEDLPPMLQNTPDETVQDIINAEIGSCHFFVLILNKRYGNVEAGHTKSNTEREIDEILRHHQQNPKKKLLAYFRRPENNPDPGPQEEKVTELKQRLANLGVLYSEYGSPAEFQELFTHDMYNVVMRMMLSPYKRECLQKFWQFTGSPLTGRISIGIVYPPVPREFMGACPVGVPIWHRRIQPNIFFEDYKAIHKIKKTLQLAGYGAFRIYPNTSLPDDINLMNRIWVCAPRCEKANQRIAAYQDRARFQFLPRTDKSARLKWKTDAGDWITITSPVQKYLQIQRDHASADGEWQTQFGRIVAKDFAVLARFEDDDSRHHTEDGEPLRDYFIAGIRGLGTWGAGFLLDRRAPMLADIPDTGDAQMLIEVTYSNDRILEVRIVSDEPATYFKDQTRVPHIKKVIREHQIT